MQDISLWISLKSVPGVGNLIFKRLIDRFGSPAGVLCAPENEIARIQGISRRLVSAIRSHHLQAAVMDELKRAADAGCEIVPLTDPCYPPLLRQIPDPPPYLYAFGELSAPCRAVAVVGSRHATEYGITTTRRLCSDLAARGIEVVSGMARGIDTAAHEGALAGGGKTIAVLGSGLGRIYPSENRALFHRIGQQGAVVSEFSMMTGPDAHNFPRRNRIISGIALGTVVVEATRNSGSLITAGLAAEQNREVFAVPGSIRSYKSTGTHTLIKQGAKLVEHAQDIIDELPPAAAASSVPLHPVATPQQHPPLKGDEIRVMHALGPYPRHIDDIARQLNIETGRLAGTLLELELKGVVSQSAGMHFSLKDLS
jgi:DNA processing protein